MFEIPMVRWEHYKDGDKEVFWLVCNLCGETLMLTDDYFHSYKIVGECEHFKWKIHKKPTSLLGKLLMKLREKRAYRTYHDKERGLVLLLYRR